MGFEHAIPEYILLMNLSSKSKLYCLPSWKLLAPQTKNTQQIDF